MPIKVDNKPLPVRNKGNTSIFEIHPELIKKTNKSDDLTTIVDSAELESGQKKYFFSTLGLANNFTVEISKDMTVGREQCDIIILNKSVSSKHCTLRVKDGVLSIIDNNSTNGTYVAGHKLKPDKMVILEANDTILLGQMLVKILYEDPAIIEEQELAKQNKEDTSKDVLTRSGIRVDLVEELDRLAKEKSQASKKEQRFNEIQQQQELNWESSGVRFAGGILRFICLLADISVTYAFYSFLQTQSVAMEWLASAGSLVDQYLDPLMLHPMTQTLYAYAKPALPFIVLYFGYRVLGTLFFGVTIAQFLIGIRSTQSFFYSRVGGVLREIVGIITAPFIIFDLPTLIRWKSFKEIVTATKLGRSTILITIIGVVVFFPILFCSGIFAPILQNADSIEHLESGIMVTRIPFNSASKKIEEEIDNQVLLTSAKLNLIIKDKDSAKLVIPSFSITKTSTSKEINPVLSILNSESESESEATFSLIKKFSLSDLLTYAAKYDPMFNLSYPVAWNFLEMQNSGTNILAADTSGDSKNIKRRTVALAVERVISDSLGLGLNTMLDRVKESGPFIMGAVQLRKKLLEIIDIPSLQEIQVEEISGIIFLQAFDLSNPIRYSVRLIPLGVDPVPVFEYSAERKNNSSIIDFKKELKKFFSNVEWNFYSVKGNDLPPVEQLNHFSIIDFLLEPNLLPSQLEQIDMYLFGYLFELSKDSISKKNLFLQKELRSILNRYLMVVQTLANRDPERKKLFIKLEELTLAHKNVDLTYYQLDPAQTEKRDEAIKDLIEEINGKVPVKVKGKK